MSEANELVNPVESVNHPPNELVESIDPYADGEILDDIDGDCDGWW